MKDIKTEELRNLASLVRRDIIEMSTACKTAAHPGPALSCADIVTALYFKYMDIDSLNPEKENRDRFILSKGHASPLLYSVLAQHGLFDEKELMTFRKFGSRLQGHPAKDHIPGVETSTGSLGQGLSIGCGIALGLKLDKNPATVVVYTGDGELQEGSCSERFSS